MMPQKWLSVRDFDKYKPKASNPHWFPMHISLFGDPDFMKLSTHHRYLYVGLIHLAVETNNKIYNDATFIGQRLYIPHTEIDLKPLYRSGLLVTTNLSRTLSEERTERRGEERTGEDTPLPPKGALVVIDDFHLFWNAYPKKKGKDAAYRRWERLKADGKLPAIDIILQAIREQKETEQWKKDGGQFIPHPATWLNGGCWADEPVEGLGPSDPNGFLAGLNAMIERHS